MSGFGKAWRVLRYPAIVLGVAAACLVAGTLVPRPFASGPRDETNARHRILVLMNAIHTDIAIPLEPAVLQSFAFTADAGQPIDAPGARYLVIGWGGRDFYTQTPQWSQLKLVPFLKGVTLDRAVMHVDVAGAFREPDPQIIGFDLGDAAFAALLAKIEASFARNAGGPILLPEFHYGDYDAFYEANGKFTAILGCNTWAAAVLRAGGIRTGWWNPLPETLKLSLRLFN